MERGELAFSPRVISYIRVALNAAWIVVAVTSVLSISSLAPYLSGALTISGLVTLAVSLALQTTFSNMIAGILLFQDNTLRIGDDILYGSIRGQSHQGLVENYLGTDK